MCDARDEVPTIQDLSSLLTESVTSAKVLEAQILQEKFLASAALVLALGAVNQYNMERARTLFALGVRSLAALDVHIARHSKVKGDPQKLTVTFESVVYGNALSIGSDLSPGWPDVDTVSITLSDPSSVHRSSEAVAFVQLERSSHHENCTAAVLAETRRYAAVGAKGLLLGGSCASENAWLHFQQLDVPIPTAVFRPMIGVHITTILRYRPDRTGTVTIMSQTSPFQEDEVSRLRIARGFLDTHRQFGERKARWIPPTTSKSHIMAAVAASIPSVIPNLLEPSPTLELWKRGHEETTAVLSIMNVRLLRERHLQSVPSSLPLTPTPWTLELDGVPVGLIHPDPRCPLWPADQTTTLKMADPTSIRGLGASIAYVERHFAHGHSTPIFQEAATVAGVGGVGLVCCGAGCADDNNPRTPCNVPVAIFRPFVGFLVSTMLRRSPHRSGTAHIFRSATVLQNISHVAVSLREVTRDVLESTRGLVSYTTIGHPLARPIRPPEFLDLRLRHAAHSADSTDLIVTSTGTITPLHVHKHQLVWHTLVFGEKRWIFVSPTLMAAEAVGPLHISGLHGEEAFTTMSRGLRSRVFGDVIEVNQERGSVVVIPPGWGHAVLSVTPSIAYSKQLGDVPSSTLLRPITSTLKV